MRKSNGGWSFPEKGTDWPSEPTQGSPSVPVSTSEVPLNENAKSLEELLKRQSSDIKDLQAGVSRCCFRAIHSGDLRASPSPRSRRVSPSQVGSSPSGKLRREISEFACALKKDLASVGQRLQERSANDEIGSRDEDELASAMPAQNLDDASDLIQARLSKQGSLRGEPGAAKLSLGGASELIQTRSGLQRAIRSESGVAKHKLGDASDVIQPRPSMQETLRREVGADKLSLGDGSDLDQPSPSLQEAIRCESGAAKRELFHAIEEVREELTFYVDRCRHDLSDSVEALRQEFDSRCGSGAAERNEPAISRGAKPYEELPAHCRELDRNELNGPARLSAKEDLTLLAKQRIVELQAELVDTKELLRQELRMLADALTEQVSDLQQEVEATKDEMRAKDIGDETRAASKLRAFEMHAVTLDDLNSIRRELADERMRAAETVQALREEFCASFMSLEEDVARLQKASPVARACSPIQGADDAAGNGLGGGIESATLLRRELVALTERVEALAAASSCTCNELHRESKRVQDELARLAEHRVVEDVFATAVVEQRREEEQGRAIQQKVSEAEVRLRSQILGVVVEASENQLRGRQEQLREEIGATAMDLRNDVSALREDFERLVIRIDADRRHNEFFAKESARSRWRSKSSARDVSPRMDVQSFLRLSPEEHALPQAAGQVGCVVAATAQLDRLSAEASKAARRRTSCASKVDLMVPQ